MTKMEETKVNMGYADDLVNTGEGIDDAGIIIRKHKEWAKENFMTINE